MRQVRASGAMSALCFVETAEMRHARLSPATRRAADAHRRSEVTRWSGGVVMRARRGIAQYIKRPCVRRTAKSFEASRARWEPVPQAARRAQPRRIHGARSEEIRKRNQVVEDGTGIR